MAKKRPPPSNPDLIAVHAYILGRHMERETEVKRAGKLIAQAMQRQNISPAEIRSAWKEATRSAVERQAEQERKALYLQAIGAPVQMELFEIDRPRRNDLAEIARQKGRMDTIAGCIDADNPYPAGSEEGQAWLEGHYTLLALVTAYYVEAEGRKPREVPEEEVARDVAEFDQVDLEELV